MATLIPLRASSSSRGGDGVVWINPEHIVTAQQVLTDTGSQVVLDVELKLVGVNLFRARLGIFPDNAAASEAWDAFIGQVQSA